MGRIKFHATYGDEAQHYTTWRRGTVRVVIQGFTGNPDQMDWAESFSQRVLGAFRGEARTLLCTGGDRTDFGRQWGILIDMGDQSEEDVDAEGFWPLADDWLADDNPNTWDDLERAYLREWEEGLEVLNDTDDAYGDYTVEVDGLRVWEK